MFQFTRCCILLFALLLAGTTYGAQTRIELIELRHRTAAEVIPLIAPFIGPDDAVSGTGYQLILRTTPQTLEQIREVLKTIDTAPRRLRIIVQQDTADDRTGSDGAASGSVIIRTPSGRSPAVGGRANARVYGTRSDEQANATQQVVTLEGSPALIQIGQSVPIVEQRYMGTYGQGAELYESITYRDVTTGFQVLPRLRGDMVTLEISPHRQTLSPDHPGRIDVQEMHTTISGRLGEWIDIGGVVEQQYRHESGTVHSTRDARLERRRVLVKVEEIP